MKNNILAIEAAPAAIPLKPNMAAIIAITKNVTTHLSILSPISCYKIRHIILKRNILSFIIHISKFSFIIFLYLY